MKIHFIQSIKAYYTSAKYAIGEKKVSKKQTHVHTKNIVIIHVNSLAHYSDDILKRAHFFLENSNTLSFFSNFIVEIRILGIRNTAPFEFLSKIFFGFSFKTISCVIYWRFETLSLAKQMKQ